jgi:ABC-2 type transport system ATP-binding protein
MPELLACHGLTKRFPAFTLHALDFQVQPGTITGLVGENGAGKSTLIKLILGLLEPDGGEIRLFGQDIRRGGAALRARIGFVQENPGLWPLLRIPDLGCVVGRFYPTWNAARFEQLCVQFELPKKTPFQKLSQGTRMKTALALALSHEAELLILDEPTSGLDPLARRELLDLLLEVIQDDQRAVLFSTHITSDLERVADHVAFLRQGHLVLSGAKDELLEAWGLVKGGESLLATPIGQWSVGGRRTELGLELLCRNPEALRPLLPPDALLERPRLEDLLYFHGRELEAPCAL